MRLSKNEKYVLGFALIIGFLWYTGYIQLPSLPSGSVTPGGGIGTGEVINKPLKFSLTSPYEGSAVPSASIYVYDTNNVLLETLTTGADGTISTALPYQSGTQLRIKVTATNYVTQWHTVTVPKMLKADAETLTYNYIPLTAKNIGTGTVVAMLNSNGSAMADGGIYNVTSTPLSVTFTVVNTEDNSGWATSQDPITGVNQGLWAKIYSNGSDLNINGVSYTVTRGTTTYYFVQIPDSAFDKQKVGNEYPQYKGTYSLTLSFAVGGLSNGEVEKLTVDIMEYFDPAYFAIHGSGGPLQTELCDFEMYAQGSGV